MKAFGTYLNRFLAFLLSGAALWAVWTGLSAGREKPRKRVSPEKHYPLFRLGHPVDQLKLSSRGRYLAFTEYHPVKGKLLKYLDMKTRKIFQISDKQVGGSYLWAPHGYRLIYRIQSLVPENGGVMSSLTVWDCVLRKNVTVRKVQSRTGFLSIDPFDFKVRTMGETRLYVQQLRYPGSRLAGWQKIRRKNAGTWVGTQKGMLWLSAHGTSLKRLADDGTPLESFVISPDARHVAWATKGGRIFIHTADKKPVFLDYGRHPAWHPRRQLLLYSGAHQTGPVSAGFDIKVSNIHGQKRWLTHSPYRQEAWPLWMPNQSMILYTIDHTSDLFIMDTKNEISARTVSGSS